MKVLVTTASKHGATDEIAEAIAVVLRDAGHDVTVSHPDYVHAIAPYDAVVLGSAVYIGRWMHPSIAFAERHADELATRPVWLFSSGPVGETPVDEAQLTDVAKVMALTKARAHHTFHGRLDKSTLGLGERAVVRMVHAPEGDYRDWDEITTWARGISDELSVVTNAPAAPVSAS